MYRLKGEPLVEGLLFLRLWQMPSLGRFLNSQKSQPDFFTSVFLAGRYCIVVGVLS